jgi:hypothetical protein
VLCDAEDRVCVAPEPIDCQIGKQVELPPLVLIEGGFIEGQVTNMFTGEPMALTEDGQPITIGVYGPGEPMGEVIRQYPATTVTPAGRYRLRAAPGANYPYLVNIRGDRMAWDTKQRPALMVEAGKTISYDMTITPKIPAADKLVAARKIVAELPGEPEARVEKILESLAPIRTVDNQELWCSLMRELVAVGPVAVPRLSQELDATNEQFMLRRLGFALRAIGDVRAVPALIRAIPKTLQPPMSDYGQIVEDAELMAFMQEHDLYEGVREHFNFGRPFREIFGALHKLTGQNFDDMELNFMSRRAEGTLERALQERLYRRKAEQWAAWWNEHGREFTDDPAYQTVTLPPAIESRLPAPRPLRQGMKVDPRTEGATLSPANYEVRGAKYFVDLETGYQPQWPADVPRDEARIDFARLGAWAAENGVDLMCVTHRAGDAASFELRAFGAKVRQLSSRERRNLNDALRKAQLPAGREVVDVLLPTDEEGRPAPGAKASFVVETREGGRYVIDVTDRVTRTADLTGTPSGMEPAGVGLYLGVRYDVGDIAP